MWVGGQRYAPAALPPRNNQYPLYRGLVGPQSWSGRVWKISPPPEFDPRTVQPVAIRYTDWATPDHLAHYNSSHDHDNYNTNTKLGFSNKWTNTVTVFYNQGDAWSSEEKVAG
jgi:hypothetical protein